MSDTIIIVEVMTRYRIGYRQDACISTRVLDGPFDWELGVIDVTCLHDSRKHTR